MLNRQTRRKLPGYLVALPHLRTRGSVSVSLAAALLSVGDQPGLVVEVAHDVWVPSRLRSALGHVLRGTNMRIAGLCTRSEAQVCDCDGRDVTNGERSSA